MTKISFIQVIVYSFIEVFSTTLPIIILSYRTQSFLLFEHTMLLVLSSKFKSQLIYHNSHLWRKLVIVWQRNMSV